MSERVRLHTERFDGWRSPHIPEPLQISSAAPLWKARQGRLIHRPRNGAIYLEQDGSYRNLHFTWLCGNSSNNPIRLKPECMDGLEECIRCRALAVADSPRRGGKERA